jgi:hypothetical protein
MWEKVFTTGSVETAWKGSSIVTRNHSNIPSGGFE